MTMPTYPGLNSKPISGTNLTGRLLGASTLRSYLRLNAASSSYVSFGTAFTPSGSQQIISCKVRAG